MDTGFCPFIVHGLTGSNLEQLGHSRPHEITARAVEYFKSGGKVLGIGQAEQPESIYDNPQLYPQMFPWLFPYGLGGFGNNLSQQSVSEMLHKKHLLMYHDKRFQMDPYFPLIAFNHEQIKKATTGGYLLANKDNFNQISTRLLNTKESVLTQVIEKLERGFVKTDELTPDEQECYKIINDIDYIGAHVPGSITSRKHMRNQIWSLI